jgi:hypothetical protein
MRRRPSSAGALAAAIVRRGTAADGLGALVDQRLDRMAPGPGVSGPPDASGKAKRRNRAMAREKPRQPRSKKAGSPPKSVTSSPRVRRRAKSAKVAVRKDTMLSQAPEPPRVAWSASKPSWKKR